MGRRVVYIIVEDFDEGKSPELTLKLDSSAQAIQLKGGDESLKIAETDPNKADAIQLRGGEELEIDNPANQETIQKMVQGERETSQVYPTSADSDETIQPKSFWKRLANSSRTLTWETAKTIFKATIGAVVRFLFHILIGLPF